MEAEPEKLSPPEKAGSQAYGGGAREAEPAGKGWSCAYFYLFIYFSLLHPFKKKKKKKKKQNKREKG